MARESAYRPLEPARRPGGRPPQAPRYRVLVHRKFKPHWDDLANRVGAQQARQLWDHIAMTPGEFPATANSCMLKGRAGRPQGEGWSKTIHYEVSSMARVDYQYNDNYRTTTDGDPHRVVAVLTVNFSSH